MDAQSGGYAGTSAGSATDPFGRAGAGAGAHGLGAQGMGGQGAGDQGAAVLDQAKDAAQHIAGQVKDQVGQRAESAFDQGKARVADTVDHVAHTLRQSTQQLRDQQEQRASQYVDRAAEQLERFGGYLRTADVHDMADRVEDAARRQPALFLGGMLALGLAGARFLKSSRRNATPQRATSGYAGYRGYPSLERGPGGYRAGASYGGASGMSDRLSGSSANRGLGDVSGTGASGGYAGERDVTSLRGTGAEGSGLGSSGLGSAPLGGVDPLDPTRIPRR